MIDQVPIAQVVSKSMDIETADKEKLKAVFPQCFTEGKLDIDKLLSLCGAYIDNDFEKYKFEWKGKSECYRIAARRSTCTLRPASAESVNFDTTNNLYIEGDNLEVLKLLQTAYYRKVKIIYIDPPYNTGNDFVYEDDFKDPIAKYKEITSQTTKSNPETMGRYHTNWLNMMYPRLRLAANLLRDDGVIFISIDDNEVDNLKKLCNEVFGEENFVAQFTRVTKKAGKTTDTIAKNNDYVIGYQKSFDSQFKQFNHTDEGFQFEDEYINERGKYKLNQTLDYGSIQYSPSLDYEIKINEEIFIPGNVSKDEMVERQKRNPKSDFCWRWSRDLFSFGFDNGFIVVKESKNGKRIYTKTYQNATISKQKSGYQVDIINRTKAATTLDFIENCYSNDNSKKDLNKLFESSVFDYSKPVSLIKQLIFLTASDNDIILDFFSGSATTAHAVMQLNAEDGGNRQFIMVQLPEVCDETSEAFKAGYKNICEIGKERIRRAGTKILASLNSSPLRGEDKGEGDTLNSKMDLLDLAKEMRHNPTEAEKKLWYSLNNQQLGCKFRRQHQIGNYIVDFVCLEKKLIVECDGGQHNEHIDKERTEFLEKEGYRILRFWNNEILSNLEGVLIRIKETLDNKTTHPSDTVTLTPTLSPQGRGGIPDVGFKVFKLDTSNLIKWDDTPLDSTQTADLFNRLDGMEKSLKKDRTDLDVVYEVMAKLGIPLTYKVSELSINNLKVYSIGDDGLILVCLDASNSGITPEDITAMCELTPAKIIAAEEAFKDDVSLSNAYYMSKDSGVVIELL